MSVFRSPQNPIIQPNNIKSSRSDFEVVGVFNAGVTQSKDEVILLLRVAERPINNRRDVVSTAVYDNDKGRYEIMNFFKNDPQIDFSDPRLIITDSQTYLTSISHLRLARSRDGLDFVIENIPSICPSNYYETFGIEDPRITYLESKYYISYVTASPAGVATSLISTQDFKTYHRYGIIFCPENKNVAIFPGKIGGKYYALHRPSCALSGKKKVWIAESPDLLCWGNHRCLMGPRKGCWDETRIGAGAVPFQIEQGWLEVYHGADRHGRYCLGAVLLDGREPWKVIARTENPILEPQTKYECSGFFGNVVFSCGLLCEKDTIRIYYGAADTSICYAELSLEQTIKSLRPVV